MALFAVVAQPFRAATHLGLVEGGGFLWVRRGWFLAADFFLRAVDFFFFAGAGSSFVADTRLEWRGR